MSDKQEILFGPNVWLIDEMYRQYLDNPESVSESWRDFFGDYKPSPFNAEAAHVTEKKDLRRQRRQLVRGNSGQVDLRCT
jgi:2-oxoglutarate dehydrogenase complex dehydrogenase (E1) component-like enzyme